MKQWGLALHNHHDAHNKFPAGCSELFYFVPMVGVTVHLLPYMEQQATYDTVLTYAQSTDAADMFVSTGSILPAARGEGNSTAGVAFRQALEQIKPISYLLCPSDGNSIVKIWVVDDSSLTAPQKVYGLGGNVMPCAGDAIRYNSVGNLDNIRNVIISRSGAADAGCLPPGTVGAASTASRGMFMPTSWKNFGNTSDGTSNTIAASETVAVVYGGTTSGADDSSPLLKGGIVEAGRAGTPQECLNMRINRSEIQFPSGSHYRGILLLLGSGDNRFTTILPPNSPSCFFAADVTGDTITATPLTGMDPGVVLQPDARSGIFSASSNHTGGVNCAFMDGAVRFVSDSVDYQPSGTKSDGTPKTWDDWSVAPTGQSLYGVWGALGTPSGGESKSL
jgi:prepilin-type processing-associated H-X9-DG protein